MRAHEDKRDYIVSKDVDLARAIIGSILSRGRITGGSLVA